MLRHAPERATSSLPPVAEATRAVTIGLAAAAWGLVAAYIALPAQRAWLAAGNGLVDFATAVLLFVTAALGWWAIRRTPGAARWCHLLPAAAVLGLLDEVHFGAGVFGFDLPQVGPVTVDGISALLAVARHVASTQLGLGPMDLAAAAALLAAVASFLLARRRRAARAVSWLADHPPAVHLLGAATLVTATSILDLVAGTGTVRFVEEWLEFAAASLLCRGVLLIPQHDPETVGWRQRLRPWLDGDTPQRTLGPMGPGRPGR
jgi:hypothetical protein